jgi:PPK2 family polyphosphate:nucleotide phosphotransferase
MKLSAIKTEPEKHFNKDEAHEKLAELKIKMEVLHRKLYSEGKKSLLIILQGLDASGKDGAVKNVFSGLNPLGISAKSFKSPSKEELSHDFLWRIHKECPGKGTIKLFNRSHYEDVLVPVVEKFIDKKTIEKRFKQINDFEKMLVDNGTMVLKFYLHISREEQLKRLTERKTNPEKHWKHNDGDWETRAKWDCYMDAYEDIFKHCNEVNWHIIPSDSNRYKELHIAEKVVETLEKMLD